MRNKLIQSSIFLAIISSVFFMSFFIFFFLGKESISITSANAELRNELIKLKETQSNLELQRLKLDKQHEDLNQKLNKIAK